MPNDRPTVTDSWKAYEQCITAIGRFTSAIRVDGKKIWVGDVCLIPGANPHLEVPLAPGSADLVGACIGDIERLMSHVIESIHGAIAMSRRVIDDLKKEGEVDTVAEGQVMTRARALDELHAKLIDALQPNALSYHPATLLEWHRILNQSFTNGDPRVRVRVVSTYVM